MTINKFQGKTKEEAIEKAKAELGQGAVIMNVKEIKPTGLFKAFKSSIFEVTAAMEEKEVFSVPPVAPRPQPVINTVANDVIEIPKVEKAMSTPVVQENKEDIFDKKLDSLSERIDEQMKTVKKEEKEEKTKTSEELNFIRILYNTLYENEVEEKYINLILEEVERFIKPGNSVDTILSNVYQKLVLKFGQPKTISTGGPKPRVVFFIGPTGVGKTTTIAKIASKYKIEYNKKVAFITADTYRIAATEQLRIYANILDAPMSIVYSPEEINTAIEEHLDYDMIFVDTAGFSHKNAVQRNEIKALLEQVNPSYEKDVYLVVSATTKYQDLEKIVDIYKDIAEYSLIFTKLDETTYLGNILNVRMYSGADLSYVTYGQNVPDDIEVVDTQKIVKQLLGGK